VVAGILWLQSRHEFHRWVARYVTLSFLAVVAFILFPAAPPWAAARCVRAQVSDHPSYPACLGNNPAYVPGGGLLGRFVPTHAQASPYVERISGRGFGDLHLTVAKAVLNEGQGTVDLVAAIPSLHAGVSLLVVLFLWKRWRIYWRVLGVTYVLVGWALAALVMAGVGWSERWFERWRVGRRLGNADGGGLTRYAGATKSERFADQPMENLCPPIETMPSSA
jgi:PAP2 superfamily